MKRSGARKGRVVALRRPAPRAAVQFAVVEVRPGKTPNSSATQPFRPCTGRWSSQRDDPTKPNALTLLADPRRKFHGLQWAVSAYSTPMKSMTGYGRGDCARDGFNVTVELSSVNRKQAEISVNLPRELEMLEARVREAILKEIARGRLTTRVAIHAGDGKASARMHLNVPLAKAYAHELAKLARELKLAGPITLDQLVRAPGVFQTDAELVETENLWPAVAPALQAALAALVKMRSREGNHLAQDLAARVAVMRKCVERVAKQAPKSAARYRQQLIERIQSAGLPAPAADDERLLKEIVYFADRSDITEELTRLQSHFQQFEDCRKAKEPVGRTLDFLAQEMNREINTIGAKANDALISSAVVTLKAELEKFREQAQNVE